jgi:hypothetical protein
VTVKEFAYGSNWPRVFARIDWQSLIYQSTIGRRAAVDPLELLNEEKLKDAQRGLEEEEVKRDPKRMDRVTPLFTIGSGNNLLIFEDDGSWLDEMLNKEPVQFSS